LQKGGTSALKTRTEGGHGGVFLVLGEVHTQEKESLNETMVKSLWNVQDIPTRARGDSVKDNNHGPNSFTFMGGLRRYTNITKEHTHLPPLDVTRKRGGRFKTCVLL